MASGETGQNSPCTPKGRAKRKDGAYRCMGWEGLSGTPKEGSYGRGSLRNNRPGRQSPTSTDPRTFDPEVRSLRTDLVNSRSAAARKAAMPQHRTHTDHKLNLERCTAWRDCGRSCRFVIAGGGLIGKLDLQGGQRDSLHERRNAGAIAVGASSSRSRGHPAGCLTVMRAFRLGRRAPVRSMAFNLRAVFQLAGNNV